MIKYLQKRKIDFIQAVVSGTESPLAFSEQHWRIEDWEQ